MYCDTPILCPELTLNFTLYDENSALILIKMTTATFENLQRSGRFICESHRRTYNVYQ